jgi:nitrite reductase (NADH) small subunit
MSTATANQQWESICPLERIFPNTGVCALVNQRQIAVFRVGEGMDVYAIDNYDPFSKAYVLSRGIVGDKNGTPKVASPIYKQNFSLLTGECLDDATVKLSTYIVRVFEGNVQVAVAVA